MKQIIMIKNDKLVILVDDDGDDREFFRHTLHLISPSYILLSMIDGAGIIDYFADQSNEIPFVVFLDINMPKIGGFECLERIREKHSFMVLPVVMYSTSMNGRDIEKSRQLGADVYIQKPTDINTLRIFIERTFKIVDPENEYEGSKSLIIFSE